jgi:hypothetical protein
MQAQLENKKRDNGPLSVCVVLTTITHHTRTMLLAWPWSTYTEQRKCPQSCHPMR